MSSPITTALSQIATDWIATTPPDRTEAAYAEASVRGRMQGTAGDRTFLFDLPRRIEVTGQRGEELSQVRWSVVARVRLSAAGRTSDELTDAVANEGNLLARQIEARATWPSGVLDVQVGQVEADKDDGGDAIVGIELTLWTEETD